MRHYILLLFFGTNIIFAQSGVPFTPTKGKIIFDNNEVIEDAVLHKKSVTDLVNEAARSVENENNTAIDTVLKNQLITFLQSEGTSDNKKHFVFHDSLIIAYQTAKNTIMGDYTLINPKKSTYSMLAKKDSVTVYIKDRPYTYSDDTIISLLEFRDEVRYIKGYKCFRVMVTLKENSDDSDFKSITEKMFAYKELWVTESIKCLYHPVIYNKQILQHYYPLHIAEYSDAFKGKKIIYSLESITLK